MALLSLSRISGKAGPFGPPATTAPQSIATSDVVSLGRYQNDALRMPFDKLEPLRLLFSKDITPHWCAVFQYCVDDCGVEV